MNSALRRIWLLTAQVIAVAAGVLTAWRAFGPVPAAAPPAGVVTVREAAQTASPSASGVAAGLEAGFRAGVRKASASVVNVYTRKTPLQRPQGRWQPHGDSEQDPTQGQASLGSGVIVATQGYFLTNNHVIDGADEIAVMLPDGKVAQARVIGANRHEARRVRVECRRRGHARVRHGPCAAGRAGTPAPCSRPPACNHARPTRRGP